MIIKQLSVGAKVRDDESGVVFLVADHNHTGYEGTALITDCAIKIAAFDAAEPDNPDSEMKEFGNNFYPDSNIHRWLNSSSEKWYKPAHEFDAAPTRANTDQGRLDIYEAPFYSKEAKYFEDYSYLDDKGFLSWFPKAFVDSLVEVRVSCFIDQEHKSHGPPNPIRILCKVFLLSGAELGCEYISVCPEGFRYGLFADGRMRACAPTPVAIKRDSGYVYNDCSLFYWLRSPAAGTRGFASIYYSDHKMATADMNMNATSQLPVRSICGIRPAMNIDSTIQVTDKPDQGGAHSFIY